jgi:hypothetical protein
MRERYEKFNFYKEDWNPLSSDYRDNKPLNNKSEIKNKQNILKKLGYKSISLKGMNYDEIIKIRNKYRPNIVTEFEDNSGHTFLHYNNWGNWNYTIVSKHGDTFWVK